MTVGQGSDLGTSPFAYAQRWTAFLRSPLFPAILGFLAFEAVYLLAFRFAISFGPASFSPLWLPSSVLLCALLKSPPERWWLFIVGIVPLRLLGQPSADFPLWLALAMIGIDIAKGLAGAIALRRFMRNPLRFDSVRDLAVFVLVAVLVIPALSSFAGVELRAPTGDEYWSVWFRWFMGDALTQLVVTPPILYWVLNTTRTFKSFDSKRLPEAALIACGLVLAGYWCMAGGGSVTFAEARFYASVPFMAWAALRFGVAGASGAIAIAAAFMVNCALERMGPFAGLDPDEAASALQNYLFLRAAPGYLIAASTDQRNAIGRALYDSQRRFRAMADSAPMLLWMSGTDKLCTFFNHGWLAFTGRTMEQEIGNGWAEGVHPNDLDHCLDVYQSAFDARQRFELEYRLRRHDGEYRWVLDVGTPRFAENGEFLGYIGSALDITDRKLAEESDRALAHVQRLAIIGELTAAIAHELRQPLSAILSNAEAGQALLALGEPPLDEMREIIADIQKSDLRANEVLGHVQDFLRKREPRMEPLDVNEAVEGVLPLIAGDARKRRIRISTELGESLPPVLGNRTQLQQVLINLLVNAMDAMSGAPHGKRQITLQTRPDGDGHIEVAVADCGSGIAPENLPLLFDSFFTTRPEGMGLGLSIVRSIIQSHRGRIWAENNEAGGATFRFTVPVAKAPPDGSAHG